MKHKPKRIHVSNDRLRSLSLRVCRMRLHNENNHMIDLIINSIDDLPFGSLLSFAFEFGLMDFVRSLRGRL